MGAHAHDVVFERNRERDLELQAARQWLFPLSRVHARTSLACSTRIVHDYDSHLTLLTRTTMHCMRPPCTCTRTHTHVAVCSTCMRVLPCTMHNAHPLAGRRHSRCLMRRVLKRLSFALML
jgi:hypothetical protein